MRQLPRHLTQYSEQSRERQVILPILKDAEPVLSGEALSLIGKLYQHEQEIRERELTGQAKLEYRRDHIRPAFMAFWDWCEVQVIAGREPENPISKALKYTVPRQEALQVFLGDPEVAIDTNHLERGLRPIPMGKKNWLFAWTEFGAEQVGVIQSLLATCRLHDIAPYTYLVDVLQRVGEHPAKDVAQLTPRLWKEHFSSNPLRSQVEALVYNVGE